MSLLYLLLSPMDLLLHSLVSMGIGGEGRSGVLAPTSSPCPDTEKGLFVPHLGLWQ